MGETAYVRTPEMRPTATVSQFSGAHENLPSNLCRLGSDSSA